MEDRERRVARRRQTLRRLTITAASAAIGLNAALFAQTSIAQLGAGGVQDAVISIFDAVFPSAGLRPSTQPPTSAPSASPLTVTGAS